ncbi:histidine kinase [Streptomyces sp. PCS3-D2]|uniref:sensor histidine kinase n=1 Tax=Streptomyces sp. PCS3-D2 TaxID=1460244 RepID=UPI00044BEEF7|nr:histidine kinase [Streptomyces sp. PCS3-D2]WKV75433.1 histidine kinase [Streptomyces sp. PCS3-D2]
MTPRAVDWLLTLSALVDVCGYLAELPRIAAVPPVAGAFLLLARRRLPLAVFAVALVLVVYGQCGMMALGALFTLAEQNRDRRLLAAGAVAFAACTIMPQAFFGAARPLWWDTATAASMAGCCLALSSAAVFLGRLIVARRELADRIRDLRRAQEHERELHAETVLARERAHLAREMHDVVSHQVSLIAVRAGALQVTADSPDTRQAARVIRGLSAATLDELRHMVSVLRASEAPVGGLTPQPTLERLHELLAVDDLDVSLAGEIPGGVDGAVQRAVHRTVQEALTNVRKHAAGAAVVVGIREEGGWVEVTVTNTAPSAPALLLPGSRQGLTGLRERAELLGGRLTHGPTPGGGYRLHARFPSDGPQRNRVTDALDTPRR